MEEKDRERERREKGGERGEKGEGKGVGPLELLLCGCAPVQKGCSVV